MTLFVVFFAFLSRSVDDLTFFVLGYRVVPLYLFVVCFGYSIMFSPFHRVVGVCLCYGSGSGLSMVGALFA